MRSDCRTLQLLTKPRVLGADLAIVVPGLLQMLDGELEVSGLRKRVDERGRVMRGHDGASNEFRDFGDDGIAEGVQSVHPIGRFVIHSPKQGFRKTIISTKGRMRDVEQMRRATLPPLSSRAKTDALEQSFHSLAGRVGNNPSPLAGLRGSNKPAWESIPFRIIPDGGKRPEYLVKSVPGEAVNVFDDRVVGTEIPDDPLVFKPKTALLSVKSGLSTVNSGSGANVLAWEAAADDLDADGVSVVPEALACNISDILVTRDAWPVFREDSPAERIEFAKGNSSHPRSFEPEAE